MAYKIKLNALIEDCRIRLAEKEKYQGSCYNNERLSYCKNYLSQLEKLNNEGFSIDPGLREFQWKDVEGIKERFDLHINDIK